MTDSRYLDARGVADYLSISRTLVDQLVERGLLPKPIALTERVKRWDREAIDTALAGTALARQSGRAASDIIRGVADDLAQGCSGRPKAAEGR